MLLFILLHFSVLPLIYTKQYMWGDPVKLWCQLHRSALSLIEHCSLHSRIFIFFILFYFFSSVCRLFLHSVSVQVAIQPHKAEADSTKIISAVLISWGLNQENTAAMTRELRSWVGSKSFGKRSTCHLCFYNHFQTLPKSFTVTRRV